jgi:hypothetical protein
VLSAIVELVGSRGGVCSVPWCVYVWVGNLGCLAGQPDFPMMLCACGRTFMENAVLCFVLNIYIFLELSSDHKDRCKCAKF